MQKLTVELSDHTVEQILKYSTEKEISVDEFVRSCVDRYLEQLQLPGCVFSLGHHLWPLFIENLAKKITDENGDVISCSGELKETRRFLQQVNTTEEFKISVQASLSYLERNVKCDCELLKKYRFESA